LRCCVGRYSVVLDEPHFRDVLHQMVSPPAATVCSLFYLIILIDCIIGLAYLSVFLFVCPIDTLNLKIEKGSRKINVSVKFPRGGVNGVPIS